MDPLEQTEYEVAADFVMDFRNLSTCRKIT